MVTAVAAGGPVTINATLTAAGATHSGSASITVVDAPAQAAVAAQQSGDGYGQTTFSFAPGTVDIARGGTVTWTFGSVEHNVIFDRIAGAPSDIPRSAGSGSRPFTNLGTFAYQCTIHGMPGTVVAHQTTVSPATESGALEGITPGRT